jgi:hypothetical protein
MWLLVITLLAKPLILFMWVCTILRTLITATAPEIHVPEVFFLIRRQILFELGEVETLEPHMCNLIFRQTMLGCRLKMATLVTSLIQVVGRMVVVRQYLRLDIFDQTTILQPETFYELYTVELLLE